MKSSCCKIEVRRRFLHPTMACRILSLLVTLILLQAGLSVTVALPRMCRQVRLVLSATLVKGQSTTLTLKLQKSGSDQHVWEPKTNVNWVTLSPNYGSYNTITTETDTVKVTVSTANMTVGTNSGLIYIWDTGSSARLITVPLIVTVTSSGTRHRLSHQLHRRRLLRHQHPRR